MILSSSWYAFSELTLIPPVSERKVSFILSRGLWRCSWLSVLVNLVVINCTSFNAVQFFSLSLKVMSDETGGWKSFTE